MLVPHCAPWHPNAYSIQLKASGNNHGNSRAAFLFCCSYMTLRNFELQLTTEAGRNGWVGG
jgi:hypothetical protein